MGRNTTPHQVKSLNQVSFHLISYCSIMSHCVLFYYSFSFWFIIWFVMLFYDGTFWNIPMIVDEQLLTDLRKCCLVDQDSPMYIRRLSCLRERTIRFRIHSQLSFFHKIISLTVLITTSGFVINSLQGLNHSDMSLEVFIYVISLSVSVRSQRKEVLSRNTLNIN